MRRYQTGLYRAGTIIGGVVIPLYLIILNGIFGRPVMRWEVIVWGLILMAWAVITDTHMRTAQMWKAKAARWEKAYRNLMEVADPEPEP